VHAITGAPTFEHPEQLPRYGHVLTGGERKPRPPLFPAGPDAVLDAHAQQLGYSPLDLGDGWILWSPPRSFDE
jgi:hypothetical protein